MALVIALAVAAGVFIAMQTKLGRSRRRGAARPWRGQVRAPLPQGWPHQAGPAPRPAAALSPDAPDPAEQLRTVMAAAFETKPLLNRSEARVFRWAEDAVRAQELPWRVMCQVALGEVLASPDPQAHRAINAKRVDFLLVTRAGQPVAAIEYQGEGHWQGAAPARDAVKREALRRAGVGWIEMTPTHKPEDLAREIARLAEADRTRRRAA